MTGDQERELLSRAYLVAVEPSVSAYSRPDSTQHAVSRGNLRALLEALEPLVKGTTAERPVAERLATLRRDQ